MRKSIPKAADKCHLKVGLMMEFSLRWQKKYTKSWSWHKNVTTVNKFYVYIYTNIWNILSKKCLFSWQ